MAILDNYRKKLFGDIGDIVDMPLKLQIHPIEAQFRSFGDIGDIGDMVLNLKIGFE